MRYGLRTLLILLAIGPPVLSGLWLLRYSLIDTVFMAGMLALGAMLLGFAAVVVMWACGYR